MDSRPDSRISMARHTAHGPRCGTPDYFPAMDLLTVVDRAEEQTIRRVYLTSHPSKQEAETAQKFSKKRLGIMTAMTHLEELSSHVDGWKLAPLKMSPRPHSTSVIDDRGRIATIRRLGLAERNCVRTLDMFAQSEERRARALTCCVDKPVREKIDKRTIMWLQAVSCILPVKMFRELYQQYRAKKILKEMFIVQYVRYLQVKFKRGLRNAWTQERLSHMHRPTVESLRRNEIFEKLPEENLRTMIDSMTAACYRKDEVITHEGDWGSEMYVIDRGLVQIRIRVMTGKTKLKSRGEANTIVVSCIDKPGDAFGEFALLTKEPRVSTFTCVQDTDTWVLTRQNFEAAMSKLPDDTFEVLQRKADERRQLNMAKLYGMNENTLRLACKFIDGWTSRGVQKVLRRLEPKIYRKGDVVFKEGDSAEGIYILVSGKVEMLKEGVGRVTFLTPTCAFGEPGTVILGKRCATVRAVSQCDMWFVNKSDVMDAMGHESLFCVVPLLNTTTEHVALPKVKDTGKDAAHKGTDDE